MCYSSRSIVAAAALALAACHGPATGNDDSASSDSARSRACAARFGSGAASQWVAYDSHSKLTYAPLDGHGDRIMDYSFAGYMGGGVALPTVPAAQTLQPSGA